MANKKISSVVLIGGAALACAALGFSPVQAKTVKKMVVKSIDHDAKTLKAIEGGDTYTVTATNAKVRKGSSSAKSMTFSQVKEGDVVTIEGTFDDKDVTATKIRDLSYYDKHTVTFYGKIDSLNSATNTFKIKTLDRGKLTISVLSSTKLRDKDNDKIKFSDLEEHDRVFVTGEWNRKKKTITKTKSVNVLHDSEYDDLDD